MTRAEGRVRDQDGSGSPVQSVDRAISVLEMLARSGELGVSEVALELGVHKSTASRLLSALEERDLVEQDGERGRYRLGFGLLRLAGGVIGRLDLVQQGGPVLRELAALADETVNLAVLRAHYAVNVEEVRGSSAVGVQNWNGQLTPLHATSSGKVLLAHETPTSRRALLAEAGLARYTLNTVTARKALFAQLDEIVGRGWAIAYEEYEDGLNAVAAPVFDLSGKVIAAVSVSGPAYRLDAARIEALLPHVVAAARRISQRMGHLS